MREWQSQSHVKHLLQIPRGFCSEIQEEGYLRNIEEVYWPHFQGVMSPTWH